MARPPANQGPRVNLTLTDELDGVLSRLSNALGVGKATFVRQMLEGALPQLELMAQAAEQVTQKNVPDGLALMVDALRQTSGIAEQATLDLRRTRRAAMRRKAKPT